MRDRRHCISGACRGKTRCHQLAKQTDIEGRLPVAGGGRRIRSLTCGPTRLAALKAEYERWLREAAN